MNRNNIQRAAELDRKIVENTRCIEYFELAIKQVNRDKVDSIVEFLKDTRNLGTGGQKTEVLDPMIKAAIAHFKAQNDQLLAEIEKL